MVFFHLWNGRDDEESWPSTYAEPLLLAVRLGDGPVGDGPFGDRVTLTSEGRRRRPAPRLHPRCSRRRSRPSLGRCALPDGLVDRWRFTRPCGRGRCCRR